MIVMYGAATCEDTAVTRSRLHALGIAVRDRDVDADQAAMTTLLALTGGHRITPTVVVDGGAPLVEPTLEQLGDALRAAGYAASIEAATEFHGELTTRAIPLRHTRTTGGEVFTFEDLRGRHQVVLFLAHAPECLACFGYAAQLARRQRELAVADAVTVVMVRGGMAASEAWAEHIATGATIVIDPDGARTRAIAEHVGADADDAILLLLDRYLAPRAASIAPEAGGLIDPSSVVEWHEFLALECPECAGEVSWPSE